MKLKDNFLVHHSDKENILIDSTSKSFSGIAVNNVTASFILDCLAEDTTIDQISEKMAAVFEGATLAEIKADVTEYIDKLRKLGAIDE